MSTLKQIEVNGTTYDIGIPGSECPIICETCTVSGHSDAGEIANALHEKQYEATGTNYTYEEIYPLYIFIRTQEGSSEKVIVIAAPEESSSGE